MDSIHTIKGDAPELRTCDVTVTEAGSARLLRKEQVRGAFSFEFVSAGPLPPKLDIAAYCDGTKVKEVRDIAPRTAGEIDLGKLAP